MFYNDNLCLIRSLKRQSSYTFIHIDMCCNMTLVTIFLLSKSTSSVLFKLRNRSALAVNCCVINHCLTIMSLVLRDRDILYITTDFQTVIYYSIIQCYTADRFRFQRIKTMKNKCSGSYAGGCGGANAPPPPRPSSQAGQIISKSCSFSPESESTPQTWSQNQNPLRDQLQRIFTIFSYFVC